MKRTLWQRTLSSLLLLALVFLLPMQARAAEVSLSGLTFSDASISGTTVTMSASRAKYSSSATTKTVTVTNNNDYTVQLAFTYEAKTAGGSGDKGSATRNAPTNGTVESDEANKCVMTLKAGGYFTVTIVADDSYGYVGSSAYYYIMSDVSVTRVYDATDLTVNYDGTLGAVTYNNSTVNAGSTITGIAADEVLTAAPATGAQFIGWIDASGKVLSKTSTYKVAPTAEAMTVEAIFTTTTPWFYVDNGDYLVEGWEEAVTHTGTVALANNATLPAGDYSVPSTVTMLIPYDSALTASVETPVVQTPTSSQATPTAYRTLSMESGAHITVNGTLTVPAAVRAGDTTTSLAATMVKGTYGHISMNSGSSITVKSGARLSTYGYITGSGSVIAESGAKVYEAFQVMRFRGGSATAGMATAKKSFPISQYYVQNIEVPLTLHSGASEIAYVALYMSNNVIDSQVEYIGQSGCLFNLTSGYMVKQYDKTNDRQQIDLYGNLTVSKFAININYFIDYSIDSNNFVLPITNNMTVDIHDGATVTIGANMSMLPGAEIDIHKGGTLLLSSGKSLYLYDLTEWSGKGFLYGGSDMAALPFAPNRAKTRTASDLKDAQIVVEGTLDASAGKLYTSDGGAAIKGVEGGQAMLTFASSTVDRQATQSGTDISYVEIAMNSAYLQHGDGKYMVSATDTYTYANGVWNCTNHSYNEGEETTPAACTAEGEMTYTCTACGESKTEVIPATGHTEAEAVTENNVDATCTIAGSYESVIYCSVCSEEISRTKVTVDALGHQPGAEATCATAQVCTREGCGATLAEATGAHSYTVEVEGSRTAATCMATGSVTMKCTNCSATEVQTLDIDQDNHTGNDHIENAKDATCTEAGYTGDTVCECGVTVKTGEAIPAKDHNYGETSYTWTDDGKSCTAKHICANDASHVEEATATITSEVTTPASCTVMGTTTYTATFGVEWAATQVKDVQDVPVIAHTYDQQNTDDTFKQSDATCTAKATYYYSCSCGAKGTDTFEYGDKLAHSYGETQFTWNSYECSAVVKCSCGDEQNVDVTVTSEVTTTATCTVEGVKTYTATTVYNGTTYTSDQQPTEKLGLNSENHVNKTEHEQTDATCTELGYTAGTYCEDCKTWISGHEVINALEHSWTVSYEWSENGKSCTATRACGNDASHNVTETVTASGAVKTAATCQAMGWTTYTANFEAEWAETQVKDVQDIAQLQHSYTGDIKSDGNGQTATHSYKCVNGCNEYGAAVKHTWNEGEQTKNPACEAAGEMTYTCTAEGCGATYTEEIKATGHVNTTSKTEQNTDGKTHTTTVTCACNHVVSTTTENCTDNNNDFKCDTCGGLLVNAYTDAVTLAEEHTGTRTVESATVTLKVTGDVAFAQAQGTGAWNHWVGFKITSPVDMGKVTILRPDNATRVMADIKDGDDYAYLYWGMTNDADKKAEYEIDWNGDGTYDLTVVLDASEATLLECVHSWQDGKVTTPASCTTDGEMTYTCANCGKTKTEVIEPTGHKNTVTINQKDATCGAEGYTGDTYCNDCKTTIAKGKVIQATGNHVYTWTTTAAATCVAKGEETGTCSCGAETTREIEIDSNAHSLVNVEAKAATCTEPGWDAYEYCDREGCEHTTYVEKAALGHSYGTPAYQWTEANGGYTVTATVSCNCGDEVTETVTATYAVTTEPTTQTEGVGTYTATFKNELFSVQTKPVKIPKLEPTGYKVTIDDRKVLDNGTATPTATTTLDKNGIYKAGDTFTVTSAKACVVAISYDEGQTYEELSCVADGENTYRFTIPDKVNGDFQIGIVLRGDVFVDGQLNGFDQIFLARALLEEGMDNRFELDSLLSIAANVFMDSSLNGFDQIFLARALLEKGMDNYQATSWNIAS